LHLVNKEAKTVTNVDSQAGALTIAVPGELTDAKPVDLRNVPAGLFKGSGDPLMGTKLNDASVTTYATDTGSQSIISVESSAAAKDYRFPLDLPSGAVATVKYDGAVTIRNEQDAELGGFTAPWAYDANGNPVATSFAILGNDLVQTIEHGPGTAYPVVADPNDFWGWTACVGSIGVFIAGNMMLVSKVTKIGGVGRAAKMLVEARNAEQRWRAVRDIFGEATGLAIIVKACE
jgi:hypothetical protein